MIEDAFGERKYNEVMNETWGHLYPDTQTRYYGYAIFYYAEDHSYGVFKEDFPGLSGPWFYEDLNDFINKRNDIEEGHLYKFKGFYTKYKNGGYRFTGDFYEVKILEG